MNAGLEYESPGFRHSLHRRLAVEADRPTRSEANRKAGTGKGVLVRPRAKRWGPLPNGPHVMSSLRPSPTSKAPRLSTMEGPGVRWWWAGREDWQRLAAALGQFANYCDRTAQFQDTVCGAGVPSLSLHTTSAWIYSPASALEPRDQSSLSPTPCGRGHARPLHVRGTRGWHG
jgi:hypothetical protein